MNELNPYAPASEIGPESGSSFADSKRLRGGFLFRELQLDGCFPCQFRYTGWWFVQRVYINEKCLWWEISWLTLRRHISINLPADIDPQRRSLDVEIQFGRGLLMSRFQVWIGGQTVYDELT
ncbi:MAG: hypothetical protein AAF958_14595 [Planctomycetota bacterium]